MPKCKKCEKRFHACGSCGLEYEWEWNYCSQTCWETSDEYAQEQKELAEAVAMVDALTPEQCRIILRVIDNPNLLDAFIDKMCKITEEEAA